MSEQCQRASFVIFPYLVHHSNKFSSPSSYSANGTKRTDQQQRGPSTECGRLRHHRAVACLRDTYSSHSWIVTTREYGALLRATAVVVVVESLWQGRLAPTRVSERRITLRYAMMIAKLEKVLGKQDFVEVFCCPFQTARYGDAYKNYSVGRWRGTR